MNRVQKRCLIASGGMHVFLILLLVFGSAFFAPEPQPVFKGRLNVVPSRLVDAALSGGGGNPKVKPSDERLKGNTLTPQPEEPKPVAPKPAEKPPPPKQVEPPKPKPDQSREPPEPKVDEKPAPSKKGAGKDEVENLLKPLSKSEARQLKAQSSGSRDSSGSRSASGQRSGAGQGKREADTVAGAIAALRTGYADGTAVEVHGTGGAAYANYGQFIFEIYDQAWILDKDVNGEDATTKVQVIIERSGRVKEARIIRPSGNAALDATVQKALNRVKTVPPFPAGAKDLERVFIINFNLQAKLSSA
jgi:protein TonB